MGKIDIIGKTFKNSKGLEYIVLKENGNKKTEYYYDIMFIKTKSIKKVEKRNLIKGNVRDDYDKNIYNVACRGNESSTYPILNRIAFKRWYAMIERCYCETAISYKSYGKKGVFVNNKWLCFEKFMQDLPNIKGFDFEKYIKGEIQLDKDTIINGNKEYSFEKCIFIDKIENIKNQITKSKEFIAISPNGEQYTFLRQSDCAKQFNLTARTIGKVLHKQLKTHKGWKFYYKESND